MERCRAQCCIHTSFTQSDKYVDMKKNSNINKFECKYIEIGWMSVHESIVANVAGIDGVFCNIIYTAYNIASRCQAQTCVGKVGKVGGTYVLIIM